MTASHFLFFFSHLFRDYETFDLKSGLEYTELMNLVNPLVDDARVLISTHGHDPQECDITNAKALARRFSFSLSATAIIYKVTKLWVDDEHTKSKNYRRIKQLLYQNNAERNFQQKSIPHALLLVTDQAMKLQRKKQEPPTPMEVCELISQLYTRVRNSAKGLDCKGRTFEEAKKDKNNSKGKNKDSKAAGKGKGKTVRETFTIR